MSNKLSTQQLSKFADQTAASLYQDYKMLSACNVVFVNRFQTEEHPLSGPLTGVIFSATPNEAPKYVDLSDTRIAPALQQKGAIAIKLGRLPSQGTYVLTDHASESTCWEEAENFKYFLAYQHPITQVSQFNEMYEFMIISHEFGHAIASTHPKTSDVSFNWSEQQHEVFADTFAALRLLQAYPDKAEAMISYMVDWRDIRSIIAEDTEHYTSAALRDLLAQSQNRDFTKLTHEEIISVAQKMTEKHHLKFEEHHKAAIAFSQELQVLEETQPMYLIEAARCFGRQAKDQYSKNIAMRLINVMEQNTSTKDVNPNDLTSARREIQKNDMSLAYRFKTYFDKGLSICAKEIQADKSTPKSQKIYAVRSF